MKEHKLEEVGYQTREKEAQGDKNLCRDRVAEFLFQVHGELKRKKLQEALSCWPEGN